jgi:hypothetical protein
MILVGAEIMRWRLGSVKEKKGNPGKEASRGKNGVLKKKIRKAVFFCVVVRWRFLLT